MQLNRDVGTPSRGPTGAKERGSVVEKERMRLGQLREVHFREERALESLIPWHIYGKPVPVGRLRSLSYQCSCWQRSVRRVWKDGERWLDSASGALHWRAQGRGQRHLKAHSFLCLSVLLHMVSV